MHHLLNKSVFFIKEHKGILKASNSYDIADPESGEVIMNCREDSLGIITKLLRFSKYKRMTPFDISIKTPEGERILRIKRGISLFLSKVRVYNEQDELIGLFKQKMFAIGGAFRVLDENEVEQCELKGKWTSWEFSFNKDGQQLALVTKKWAGLGKELFTSADNYVLQINDVIAKDDDLRQLIMAAVMCIDMVLKE